MTDTKSTLTWLLRDQVSVTAKKVNDTLEKVGTTAGKNSSLMDKLRSATGGLLNPLTLAAGGATLLVGGLLEAGKEAAAEQINIAKLGTALRASVPDWDGNTTAIEKLISQRENLGFSDDDLRNSFATLVTSTHDVGQATDLQTTAMDLARLKGIDLATASEALAKANVGSTRELKALGIAVDDSKDKTQVFAAIQKAAAGQAAAYAETSAGKWEAMNVKFHDVVETVGAALLPAFSGIADFALNVVFPALDKVFGLLGRIIDAAVRAFEWLGKVGSSQQTLNAGASRGSYRTPSHAQGGMLDPGWNLVGEQGPELISPSRMVYPAGQTRQIMDGGAGRPVEIPVVIDGREVARVVDRHLFYSLRNAAIGAGS